MSISGHKHPLNASLRTRLHLPQDARLRLALLRMGLSGVDGLSRLVTGKPFFALRETETLLRQLDGKHGLALVKALLGKNGGTGITAHGIENIPKTGPVIIASTHPTGMFDYLAHAAVLLDQRPDLRVVANRETELFLGADLIVGVKIDKQNRALSARKSHAEMNTHLQNGGALLIFGSGRVPYLRAGQLVEPGWRRGASRISETTQAPIIPACPNARNSPYYYRIRAMARKLKHGDDNFGAMIGSLRYAAELLEKLGRHYEVHYGQPLPPGSPPAMLKSKAEALVPGLYAAGSQDLDRSL